MAKKNEPAGTPEENEVVDAETTATPEADKSASDNQGACGSASIGSEPELVMGSEPLVLTACAPIQGDLRLEPGSVHHSFFKALIENDTHGWLEAQGVNPKAGLDPATVLAIAKTLCSILGPVCAAISSL